MSSHATQDWKISIDLVDDVANLGRHANTLTERKSRAFALLWTPPSHVKPDGQGRHFSTKNMFHPRHRHHVLVNVQELVVYNLDGWACQLWVQLELWELPFGVVVVDQVGDSP